MGVSTGRALGVRDLRYPRPIVVMEPESASYTVPPGARLRLGFMCGAAAALSDARLDEVSARHARRPKASALRWCLDSPATASCNSAICLSRDAGMEKETPPVK